MNDKFIDRDGVAYDESDGLDAARGMLNLLLGVVVLVSVGTALWLVLVAF